MRPRPGATECWGGGAGRVLPQSPGRGRGPATPQPGPLWSPDGEQDKRLLFQATQREASCSGSPRKLPGSPGLSSDQSTPTRGRNSTLLYEADFPQMSSEIYPPARAPCWPPGPPGPPGPPPHAPALPPLEHLPLPGSAPISDRVLQSPCPRAGIPSCGHCRSTPWGCGPTAGQQGTSRCGAVTPMAGRP